MSSPALPSLASRRALQRKSISLVHGRKSRGKVCLAALTPGVGTGWNEGLVSPSSRALSRHIEVADFQYQGMHRFSGKRDALHVTGISAAFQDYDHYKAGLPYANATAEEVAQIVIAAYEAAGIPCPSFFQDSGRGAYGITLFAGMNGDALPRWQLAMKNLRGPKLDADGNLPKRHGKAKVDPKVEAFEQRMIPVWRVNQALGLDRKAIDPARVLKTMGTVHPDTGRMSCLAWPASFDDIEIVSFDAWCDALMPRTRAELAALRAERAAWKAENPDYVKAPIPKRKRPPGGKWGQVLSDLMRLLEHRGANWFAENHRRDLWAYYAATAISVTEGGNAEAWAERLAPLIGMPIHELTSALSGVERGMHAHQAGETRDWKGAVRPAFYDTSIARIVDEFDVGIEEAGELGLRILVPGGAIPLSDAERQRISRGRRDPHQALRASSKASDMGEFVHALKDAGYSVTEIAKGLEAARSTIYALLNETPAAEPEVVVEAAANDSVGDVSVQSVRSVSRSIVDEVSIPAPAALPAPSVGIRISEGEVVVRRFTPFFAEHRTATQRWTILRCQPMGPKGDWVEIRDDLPIDGPELVPAYTPRSNLIGSQDARQMALLGGLRDKSRRGHGAVRGAPKRRSAVSGATAPMAPLDVAHEAALYLAATRGS